MASFLFLVTADRFGRRTLMMWTVIGFTVFNAATALATTTTQFVVLQFLARLFLTAEYSLAIIVVGEEFPARLRGRAIAVLTSLATVGVMAMAKIQPYLLIPDGGESNWLHDLGQTLVTSAQTALGLEVDPAGWRGLYALAVFPLFLVFGLRPGYGWTTNFLGRVTEVATPIAIGALIVPLGGIPQAIAVVAVGPVIGAVLVMLYAPETRGLTLEQVQEQLAAR